MTKQKKYYGIIIRKVPEEAHDKVVDLITMNGGRETKKEGEFTYYTMNDSEEQHIRINRNEGRIEISDKIIPEFIESINEI
ncbi:MAG: hypothetical protein AABX79_02980, partial [Nanoarchaeota archaeon]